MTSANAKFIKKPFKRVQYWFTVQNENIRNATFSDTVSI